MDHCIVKRHYCSICSYEMRCFTLRKIGKIKTINSPPQGAGIADQRNKKCKLYLHNQHFTISSHALQAI